MNNSLINNNLLGGDILAPLLPNLLEIVNLTQSQADLSLINSRVTPNTSIYQ